MSVKNVSPKGKEMGPVASGPVYSTDPADFFYMGLNVPCQKACPAATNIPAYIRALYEGRPSRSYEINRMANIFPGVLGRICSRPCEDYCRHGEPELGSPVSICHIKRAAAYKETGHAYMEQLFAPLGKTVAIIGAGPAGLAAAHDLTTIGFKVVMYEAFDEPGGMLMYGIPEFRLPRDVLRAEIDGILRLGVDLKCGIRIGRDITLDELQKQYDAVLVATGCYTARTLDTPGEDLPGVFSGLDFMIKVTSDSPDKLGKKVLVIGAGFTAFDCARSALRLGSEDVTICLRRTEGDLRVTHDEVMEAKLEGVKLEGLMMTKRVVGNGRVEGIEFLRTRLGEDTGGGRRAVIPIEGSEFILPADSVIVATGQKQSWVTFADDARISGDAKGEKPYNTAQNRVYVCGDYLTGPSTVIQAVAGGRKAAEQIARDLAGRGFREPAIRMEDAEKTDRSRIWDFIPRQTMPTVEPLEKRFESAKVEVETGLEPETALEESKRCYLCYLHYEIDISRCIYCRYCIDAAPRDCIKLVSDVETNEVGAIVGYRETSVWREVNAVVIDNSRCIRCGECVRVCPVNCISVTKVEQVERMISSGGD